MTSSDTKKGHKKHKCGAFMDSCQSVTWTDRKCHLLPVSSSTLCSDANMKSLHCKESKDPNQEILISWWNVWLHRYLKTAAPNSFCLCIMSCMLPAAHQQLWRQTAECLDMQSSVQMYQHEDRAAVLLLLIHPPSSFQSWSVLWKLSRTTECN